ncbi:restriction endonuclease [Hominisplanchenecus murintestinalis]|uniref:restriction endonuclease n=1 Tax=Hominisplanchenecus murintestinalis TaxID=2941517 RepID=UPI00203F26C2|nr:restriction endonuclease [Hominisplanchenecus murintestinalis]
MAFIKKFIDGFKTKNQEQNYNILHENLSILEVEKKLKRSNELANIANKTTDRDEFYRSINKFIDNRVKNIDSFNKKTAENTLPRIICIVNEANEFLKYISTPLERLFMNSNMVGIYFILFSRFSLKSLSLGIIGELLEVSTADKLKILLSKNESANYKQSMTRNFDDMGGHQFEHFCADILRKNGFENVEVTQGSGDHGIDILAEKDDITYAIQCKRYDKPIGNDAVQQAIAGKGFYHRDIAVVMTNRNFTPQAIEEAKALGVKLWDRDRLNKMIGRGKIAPVQDKDGD